jgi:hypothetical protein
VDEPQVGQGMEMWKGNRNTTTLLFFLETMENDLKLRMTQNDLYLLTALHIIRVIIDNLSILHYNKSQSTFLKFSNWKD